MSTSATLWCASRSWLSLTPQVYLTDLLGPGAEDVTPTSIATWTQADQRLSLELLKVGVSWSTERTKLASLSGAMNDTAYSVRMSHAAR